MDLEDSDAASQPRRLQSSITPLWKRRNQQTEFYCFIVEWQAILLLPILLCLDIRQTSVQKLERTNKTSNQLSPSNTLFALDGDVTDYLLAVDSIARRSPSS
jgi:hypothetical protein